ncbi:hypothetical protein WMF26_05110 [Sorangium sp. So ce185]|uniref:hypothetical protein n=1 Tax=Sorangium sp. So ce185 TaxID=3133287 RepID=UPI003F64676E
MLSPVAWAVPWGRGGTLAACAADAASRATLDQGIKMRDRAFGQCLNADAERTINMSSLIDRVERRTHRLIATSAAALSGMLALAGGAGEASAGWTCSNFVNEYVDTNMKAASYNGRPHLFYVTSPSNSTPLLHTAFPDASHTTWTHQTLAGDPDEDGTFISPGKAATYNGTFYAPYVDHWTGALKVASKSSATGSWTHIGVDGEGENIFGDMGAEPAAVVFDGKLYIFYTPQSFFPSDRVLRVAVYDGSTWSYQLVDNTSGISGAKPIVYDGKLRVYYKDGGNVRQAVTSNGTSWTLSVLDGDGGANGRTSDIVGGDIAVVSYGSPFTTIKLMVFYINLTQENLRVADFDGSTYTFSVVDGTGGIASGATSGDIATQIDAFSYAADVISYSKPYVFYTDQTNHTLRGASFSSSAWSAFKLDGATSGNACSGAMTTTAGYDPAVVGGGGGFFVFYVRGSDHHVRKALFTP